MVIYDNNLVLSEDAVLSASAGSILFPPENLREPHLAKFTRITGAGYIQVDFSTAKEMDSVIIAGVNPFSEGGANFSVATFSASDDGFATSTNVTAISKQNNEAHLFCMFDAPISAKSFRIAFSGTGAKDIGALYLGKRYDAISMTAQSQSIEYKWTTTITTSKSGQAFGSNTLGYDYLQLKVPLYQYSESDMITLATMAQKKRNVTPVFVKLWKNNSIVRLIYARIDGDTMSVGRTSNVNKPFKGDIQFAETF